VGDYSVWPIEAQLAVKEIRDPEYSDREEVNRIREREPGAITAAEVLNWVYRLKGGENGFVYQPNFR